MTQTSGRESTLALAIPLVAVIATSFAPGVRGDVVDTVPPWPRSEVTPIPGADNPCAGIRMRHYERIEPQGFLGILTPSADWTTVEEAVNDNLSIAWKSHRLRHSPVIGEGAVDGEALRLGIDHHIRPRTGLDLLAFDFRLHEVCTEARRRGFRSLVFACGADTYEVDSDDPRPDSDTTLGYVSTRCFVSTAPAESPSWDDLLRARWGDDASSTEYAGSGRHDVIELKDFRRLQYFGLIRQVVNRLGAGISTPRPAPLAECRPGSTVPGWIDQGRIER